MIDFLNTYWIYYHVVFGVITFFASWIYHEVIKDELPYYHILSDSDSIPVLSKVLFFSLYTINAVTFPMYGWILVIYFSFKYFVDIIVRFIKMSRKKRYYDEIRPGD